MFARPCVRACVGCVRGLRACLRACLRGCVGCVVGWVRVVMYARTVPQERRPLRPPPSSCNPMPARAVQ